MAIVGVPKVRTKGTSTAAAIPCASGDRVVSRKRSTPKVVTSVFVGTSLDGFLARPSGALDFLPAGDGEPHGYEEFMATVDAIVLGRKTYDTVLGFDEWPYGKKSVFVLSHRRLASPPRGAVVARLSGSPQTILLELESRGLKHAYVDGGVTVQAFLRAGLIQRLIITRVPVLIGEGIPLFASLPADLRLRHVATRSFPSGLVQSEYRVGDGPGSANIPPLW